MTPELESWLANLKTGDPVLIASVCGTRPATVTRATPKLVFVDQRTYHRATGQRTKPVQGWLERP